MAETPPKSIFSRLDTSLMRETKSVSSTGTQEPRIPGTQDTRKMETQEAGKPVSQEPGNPGTQEYTKRATFPKQTFNIHPDVIDMLEQVKRLLRRHYNIKTSKEVITEEAIRQLCLDFQRKKEASKIVQLMKQTPGTQEPGTPGTK